MFCTYKIKAMRVIYFSECKYTSVISGIDHKYVLSIPKVARETRPDDRNIWDMY